MTDSSLFVPSCKKSWLLLSIFVFFIFLSAALEEYLCLEAPSCCRSRMREHDTRERQRELIESVVLADQPINIIQHFCKAQVRHFKRWPCTWATFNVPQQKIWALVSMWQKFSLPTLCIRVQICVYRDYVRASTGAFICAFICLFMHSFAALSAAYTVKKKGDCCTLHHYSTQALISSSLSPLFLFVLPSVYATLHPAGWIYPRFT